MYENLELLSPAGNFEKMRYAIAYGSDAVYLGIKSLSLRARENEFTLENIGKAIKYAHDRNNKVYITANIYPRGYDEHQLLEKLDILYSYEPDAFIISDPGIFMIVKDNFDIPIHLSVQANVTNKFAAKYWYKQGVKRIILARELSIEEIKEIHNYVPNLELEFFVHGSICVAYSGRCLLSAYLSKRNPNLGVCSQPCRWKYRVYLEEIETGVVLPMEEDEHGTYILNSKDLCLIEHIKELADAGIVSFKIEGRNKTEYYVSLVTKVYRKALDLLKEGKEIPYLELLEELKKASNRGFITSFIDMPITTCEKELQNYNTTSSQQTHLYVGKIKEYNKEEGIMICDIKNQISVGDNVEIITPKDEYRGKIMEILRKNKTQTIAHPGEKNVKVRIAPYPLKELHYGLIIKKR